MGEPTGSWREKMQRLRAAPLPEMHLSVCVDAQATSRVDAAKRALADARRRAVAEYAANDTGRSYAPADIQAAADAHPEVLAAVDELRAVEEAVEDATVRFTFRALPRPVYEQLQADHPPTEEDRKAGRRYNVDGFAPALLAASHVHHEPDGDGGWVEAEGMTVDDARALLTEWPQADAGSLFGAAVAVNEQPRVRVNLGKGSSPTGS